MKLLGFRKRSNVLPLLLFFIITGCLKTEDTCQASWEVVITTPDAGLYLPQGLSSDKDGIILSSYSKTAIPPVRFYRLKNKKWQNIGGSTSPLIHTSGIVPYNGGFILIDYDSGLILSSTIKEKKLFINNQLKRTDNNISSAFIHNNNDKEYLFVSVFGLFGKYKVFEINHKIDGAISLVERPSIKSNAFIQGNTKLDNGQFLEASNSIGRDKITIGSINQDMTEVKYSGTLTFPGNFIEDITIYKGHLYSTDEGNFNLYRLPWDPLCFG